MSTEENELIDLFLNGQLSEGERTAFSQRMDADVALRQRVALRKELSAYLASDETAITDLLAQADKEHYSGANNKENTTERSGFSWWWLALVAFIAIAYGCWFFAGTPESEPAEPLPNPELPPASIVVQDSSDIEVLPDDTLSPAPPASPAPAAAPNKKTAPAPVKVPPPPDNKTPVFAQLDRADFTPNPILEGMTGGQLRSMADSTSLLVTPQKDTLELADMETTSLRGYSTINPPYNLLVFDNKEASFDEDKPVMRLQVEGIPEEEGFTFSVPLSPLTRSGRFYVIVLDEQGELMVGKVLLVR